MAHTGGSNEARLWRKKFVDDQYPVTSRPVADDSENVTVKFAISLWQIREVVSLPHFIGLLSVVGY